jgi:Zn-dependent alcohol dehydrogenase
VFGIAASSGYAEFATTPAALIAKKPAGVNHEQAAAMAVAGLTAWQALFDRGRLERGQTVLIAGAAGTPAQRVRTHAREDHPHRGHVARALPRDKPPDASRTLGRFGADG